MLAVDPALAGLQLTLQARVYTAVPGFHDFLVVSDVAKQDADILGFHKSSLFVDVAGKVSGPINGVLPIIAEWVATHGLTTLRLRELAEVLYSYGATHVPLEGPDRLRIVARRITSDGNTVAAETDTITRALTERFVPGVLTVTLV